ncbi:MAG: BTAD domain-containing putative transcriptional regulator [Gemmatimonadota bacterium]
MPHLHLLGGLRAFDGERELASLHAQKIRYAALVFVAAEGETTRDALMGVLWPDRDPDRARHTLNQTIYELRKTLGADWVQTTGDRLSLSRRISVDARLFEQAAERGDYRVALELYRGDFLAGTYLVESQPFEEWAERHRSRLKRLHRKCVREALREASARGESAAALEIVSAAVELDPFDDEMQHERIRLVAAAGRPSEALQIFRRYEELLARDGLKPLDDTVELIQRIRLGTDSRLPAQAASTELVPSVPADATPATVGAVPQPHPPGRAGRLWKGLPRKLVAVAALIALIVGIGYWAGLAEGPKPVLAGGIPRIAVLYFNDNSSGGDLGYFANELTADLISALHGAPGITVLSTGAVARYRGGAIALDSIARALNATYLISGDLSRDSSRIRVLLMLSDGETGAVISTSEAIDHQRDDYYAVRDDVAANAVDLLKKNLGIALRLRAIRKETNARALELFQRAQDRRERANRQLWASQTSQAGSIFQQADSLAALAEARDRGWLRPIVLRGQIAHDHALLALLTNQSNDRMRVLLDSARLHAERALAKDSSYAPARELRAQVLFRLSSGLADTARANRMLNTAEADLNVAINTDPERTTSLSLLSVIAYLRGDFNRALWAAKEALRLDAYLENLGEIYARLAITSFETGNDGEARQWCDTGAQRFPNDMRFMHCTLVLQGWSTAPLNLPAVQSMLRLYLRSDQDPWNRGFLEMLMAGVYVRAGQIDSARAVMRRARAYEPANRSLVWIESANHTLLGERDTAVALLRSYVADSPSGSASIVLSRMFEPLRDHKGFTELMRFHTPASR